MRLPHRWFARGGPRPPPSPNDAQAHPVSDTLALENLAVDNEPTVDLNDDRSHPGSRCL